MEVKQGPNFPKQNHIVRAHGKKGGWGDRVGVRAKFTLAGANEEGKEQPLSDQIVFEKEAEVHGWQTKLISCSFPSEPKSLCLSTFLPLHFCGHFLHIVDCRQLRSMLQMLLKHIWPRNAIANKVLSIFFNSGMNECFLLHGRWQRKLVSAFTKLRKPGLCVLAGRWHLQHHKIFLPHKAVYAVPLTITVGWRPQGAFYPWV